MAKKDTRGGKRAGSGQKRIVKTVSDKVKAAWITAGKKFAKKHDGKHVSHFWN